jgi:prevent-host-death family protein
MRLESATDVKNHFGEMMDAALREPIIIQRSGRNTAVMMAYEEYEEMMAQIDAAWGKRAEKAKKNGTLGKTKSQALLKRMLSARD